MLRVTIANIDASFTGVFETDDPKAAAKQALAYLVEHKGFFPENRIIDRDDMPEFYKPSEHVRGMLVLESQVGDEDEITYAIDDENTYWVYVRPVVFGEMIDY